MRPAKPVCGGRRNGQDWWRRPLDEGTADAATSRAAGRNAQGLLPARERRATAGTGRSAGPFCEGWPIYHAVHDARVGHDLRRRRQRVARRRRLAQRRPRRDAGSSRARGSRYGEDGELKLSKVSGLAAAHGRVLAGGEAAGIFESRDGGAHLVAAERRSTASRAASDWNDPDEPAARPSRACRRSCPHPDDPTRFWVVVQGFGHLRDDRRRRRRGRRATSGLRADVAARARRRSASASTSS